MLVIVGPESCGKTTLAAWLAENAGARMVPEYGRSYSEKFGNGCDALDLMHIAAGQWYLEDEVAVQANPGQLIISDTDVLTTASYAYLYLGHCPATLWRMAADTARQAGYEHTLLLAPDQPWQPDPIRLFADRRQEHFDLLERLLKKAGRDYTIITGLGEARRLAGRKALHVLNMWSGPGL